MLFDCRVDYDIVYDVYFDQAVLFVCYVDYVTVYGVHLHQTM